MVLVFCTSSDNVFYIYIKVHENISKDFRVIEQTHFPYQSFQRGTIPETDVGGVMILFCTSSASDAALYLLKVS